MENTITLVIGSSGQIGTELVSALQRKKGQQNVIAADIKPVSAHGQSPYVVLDAMDKQAILETIRKYNVSEVYLLAALLSATSEKDPEFAWKLNMQGLFNVLDLAKEGHIKKLFWPSSIAVFGPNTPKVNTPQFTIMEPSTVYGISKLAGERWCEYYFNKFGVDVRSIRYPGLIGHRSAPGGGTTDYAVHIFHEARRKGSYECFLREDTKLPMMYMDDAIRATIELMDADFEKVQIRSSYNVSALSFDPSELALEISKHVPGFQLTTKPDVRQQIADSWPASIDDTEAREHWGWKPKYDLELLVSEMIKNI